MAMSTKKKRLILVLLGMLSLSLGVTMIVTTFRDNIVFFYSPSELIKLPKDHRLMRIGGLVKEGSMTQSADQLTTEFVLTDLSANVTVRYKGLLPNLFRAGQGMVAKGTLSGDGIFIADELLAKHDERYMPKEVADKLKKSGKWRPDGGGK